MSWWIAVYALIALLSVFPIVWAAVGIACWFYVLYQIIFGRADGR